MTTALRRIKNQGRAPQSATASTRKMTWGEPISRAFTCYYLELYRADPLSPEDDLHQFVLDLLMPCLMLEEQDFLDAEVTCDELPTAVAQ
ncbi:hypothetical protein NDU88_002551 [Pleurodeles waltl]|uniref:Uncharacterized protein n=1 Tax=Pleurodeles waltl TaxID=8319 RepID=A0AAV7MNH4_PLEWA|nr:hypothetical protein NDU88_002551 [Pleurodeles waltl]